MPASALLLLAGEAAEPLADGLIVEIGFDGTPWNPTWTDVTQWVRRCRWRLGSTSNDGPIFRTQAGTATIELDNTDRRFDPTNLVGPYISSGGGTWGSGVWGSFTWGVSSGGIVLGTQLKPNRAVRIRHVHDGVTYDLWRGFTKNWPIKWDRGATTTVLGCADAIATLQQWDLDEVDTAVGAGEDTGARINRILDFVGWPAGDRSIDTGDVTLQGTTLGRSAWAEMLLAADSEAGELYIDQAGHVVFRRRRAIFDDSRSTTSQATYGDDTGEIAYLDLDVQDYDASKVVNVATVTRVGGTPQTATDTPSITEYGRQPWTRSGLVMESDDDALVHAQFVVYLLASPTLKIKAATFGLMTEQDTKLPAILGRQLGDRVTLNRQPDGGGSLVTQQLFVRGIEHQIDAPARTWRCKVEFQAATRFSFFELGDSTFGMLDASHGLTWYEGTASYGRPVTTTGQVMTPAFMQGVQDQMWCRFDTVADREAAFPIGSLRAGTVCYVAETGKNYVAEGPSSWRDLFV